MTTDEFIIDGHRSHFYSGKMNGIIPSDVKEVLKAVVGFRTSLEAVESHIYVTIPVVYKVVR